MASFNCKVEFGGGLEMLFSNKKEHEVSVPRSAEEKEDKLPFRQLLVHLRDNLLTERVEFFMQNDTVRPGILVLINDSDWELDGGIDYALSPGDTVVFVSTLHGG